MNLICGQIPNIEIISGEVIFKERKVDNLYFPFQIAVELT